MLGQFVRLVEAPDDHYEAFATEYGPLRLCRHDRPATHNQPTEQISDSSRVCRPTFDEPLQVWSRFAKRAGAIVHLAEALRRREPTWGTEVDWCTLLNEQPAHYFGVEGEIDRPTTDAHGKRRIIRAWETDPVWPPRVVPKDLLSACRSTLAGHISGWLALGGVRVGLEWSMQRPTVALQPRSTFGALGLALANTAAATGAQLICTACGSPYAPTRRPNPGDDTYCPRADCQRAAARNRKERQRLGEPKRRQLTSEPR